MSRSITLALSLLAVLGITTFAEASHRSGCSGCAAHKYWPSVNGKFKKKTGSDSANYKGTSRSDELLGHHGSDTLSGRGGSDIL